MGEQRYLMIGWNEHSTNGCEIRVVYWHLSECWWPQWRRILTNGG